MRELSVQKLKDWQKEEERKKVSLCVSGSQDEERGRRERFTLDSREGLILLFRGKEGRGKPMEGQKRPEQVPCVRWTVKRLSPSQERGEKRFCGWRKQDKQHVMDAEFLCVFFVSIQSSFSEGGKASPPASATAAKNSGSGFFSHDWLPVFRQVSWHIRVFNGFPCFSLVSVGSFSPFLSCSFFKKTAKIKKTISFIRKRRGAPCTNQSRGSMCVVKGC